MRKNILFGVTLFSISFFSSLFQDSVAQEISETNTFFITTNLGYSPQSVIFLGKTPDTQMKYSYVGFGKQIKSPFETITMYITGGFFPFVEFSYPKRDEGSRRDLVAGFGISPLGYSFVKSFRFFELETGIKSGVNLINAKFPTDKGRRLNYSFDIKIALQKKILPQTYLSLGYKLHHISNAQTGKENPGVDSNILFISIKQF